MESEVKEMEQKKDSEYPRIMIGYGDYPVIVLMYKRGCGVVIGNPNRLQPIGYYSDGWLECTMKVFHGTVTLSN